MPIQASMSDINHTNATAAIQKGQLTDQTEPLELVMPKTEHRLHNCDAKPIMYIPPLQLHGLTTDMYRTPYSILHKPRAPPQKLPEEHKNDQYWIKRQKNNEAAKRSRLKKRVKNIHLEERVIQLMKENSELKQLLLEINQLQRQYSCPCANVQINKAATAHS